MESLAFKKKKSGLRAEHKPQHSWEIILPSAGKAIPSLDTDCLII